MLWGKKKVKCPYCQEILEKKPSRKAKCPFCKKYIYVKSDKLVTEDEAKAIEQKWKLIHELKELEILEEDYINHKRKLAKKWGFEPKVFDVIWRLLNEKTLELIKNKDFDRLSSLYYKMAIFLNKEGKDFFHILKQSAITKLNSLKHQGFKETEIMSAGACPSCQKLDKKILTIEDALKTMPIPNKDCSHVLYDEKRGFCRCMYEPSLQR